MRALILGVLAVVTGLVTGCAAPDGATSMAVEPGAYAGTFDAARRVIRDARFDLERVDASEGVISTRPKHSAGVMTLWDGEQSTAGQEVEDLVHNQRRVVRVTFVPAGAADGGESAEGGPGLTGVEVVDLREAQEPLEMRVRVYVLRDYKPGWQVQTSSVRLSTHSFDPVLARRGMAPDYESAVDEDRALAARLTARIREVSSRVEVAQGE